MSTSEIKHITFISLLTLGLTACGGGGGGSGPKIYSGVFKDSNVQGLSYVSGGQNGVTGKNGEFKYEEAGNVTFSVGGVSLGSAKAKNVMTPKDLVVGAKFDTPEVLNRVRFLMMLDKDSNPANGIEISTELQKEAKSWVALDFSKDKFNKTDPKTEKNLVAGMSKDAVRADSGDHDLPSTPEAKTHFENTLSVIKSTERCSDAGAFTGTYDGSESGNIVFILDPSTGDIKGSLFNTDKSGNHIPAEIKKEAAIDYDKQERSFVSLSTSGIKLSGKLTGNNVLEGSWVNKDDNKKKGTFIAKRIGGNGGAKYRYNALYEGLSDNNKGALAIDVDSKNKITGKAYNVKSNKALDVTGKISSDLFENVKLSDGGAITGFISKTSLSGTLKEKSGGANSFTGNGCKLN